MNKALTTMYSEQDISLLDSEMKSRSTVFKAELMKAVEGIQNEEGIPLDAKAMIAFYYDITQNAMRPNNKTGEMIEDTETRMKAMDKLIKIMTDNGKGNIQINIQNNTNIWDNIPKPGEHLIY